MINKQNKQVCLSHQTIKDLKCAKTCGLLTWILTFPQISRKQILEQAPGQLNLKVQDVDKCLLHLTKLGYITKDSSGIEYFYSESNPLFANKN